MGTQDARKAADTAIGPLGEALANKMIAKAMDMVPESVPADERTRFALVILAQAAGIAASNNMQAFSIGVDHQIASVTAARQAMNGFAAQAHPSNPAMPLLTVLMAATMAFMRRGSQNIATMSAGGPNGRVQ